MGCGETGPMESHKYLKVPSRKWIEIEAPIKIQSFVAQFLPMVLKDNPNFILGGMRQPWPGPVKIDLFLIFSNLLKKYDPVSPCHSPYGLADWQNSFPPKRHPTLIGSTMSLPAASFTAMYPIFPSSHLSHHGTLPSFLCNQRESNIGVENTHICRKSIEIIYVHISILYIYKWN